MPDSLPMTIPIQGMPMLLHRMSNTGCIKLAGTQVIQAKVHRADALIDNNVNCPALIYCLFLDGHPWP